MTTKVMLVGDTHGNANPLEFKLKLAKYKKIQHVFILGDFGLWGGMGGVAYLDTVQAMAAENDLSVFAIPGNHEDHDQWKHWLTMPDVPTWNHFRPARSRVWLSPKVNFFEFGGKRWGVAGGAVSIDKAWRKPGVSWWADEEFTDKNLRSVLAYKGEPVDYLLTHDCSDFTPFRDRLKPDPESQANRKRMDKAIAHLQPKNHFHGHMHTKYDWINTRSHGQLNSAFGYDDSNWNGASTHTYGLECDGEDNSWGILDVDTGKFEWPYISRLES